jgi:hypothetical protein
MNPSALIAPPSPFGFPAPFWFLVMFKIIGFVLHMTMMHLWYAGPILGMILWARGGNPRKFAKRLATQMPIIVALGVNFGIVPLLFVQVAYYKVFYPSTILMAWPWLSIIVFLTFAYYGVYIYATAMKGEAPTITPFKRAAGWISAILFIVIGFIFANEFSLMTNLSAWTKIWGENNVSGAVTGLALNTSDPTLWPRWLLMFGMALMSVSAYIAIDCGILGQKMEPEYRKWAANFAFKPYLIGLVWYGFAALWYIFGTWPIEVKTLMFSGNWAFLTGITAAMPFAVLVMLVSISRMPGVSRGLAIAIGLGQLLVLTFNAISRQVVQNAELSRYLNITAEHLKIQWSPMILFLILFVIGVAIIIWMIRQLTVAKIRHEG